MEVINVAIRKGIKTMCVVAQTAQFISLMPQPKDFVTRIVGDVVYLSAQIQELSKKMNEMLDSYADIPSNYIMTQMNSITGSLTGITNRVNIYAQNGVNQVMGLGENGIGMITELTGSVIDTAGELTKAVTNLNSAVAETTNNVIGRTDVAEEIHDTTEVVLEWTSDGFKGFKEKAIEPLKNTQKKIQDVKTDINNKINDKIQNIDDKISTPHKVVEKLITELREKMQTLSNKLDTGFKDVTGISSISKGANTISDELLSVNNSPAAQATTAVAGAVADVLKNFSIGKMVFAFTGVLTQSLIVRTALDQLPPIDFESMMCKIRNDLTISPDDLFKQYEALTNNTYNELIELGQEESEIAADKRNYSAKNYEKFLEEYEDELKKQREDLRMMIKNSDGKQSSRTLEKREIRSAIKEVQKYRNKVKNAKKASQYKSILGNELSNFKKEAEYRCNTLKSDWQSMMQQYRDAIAEIKEFFTNGGSCDRFIDDCCDSINKSCRDIMALCKDLITQLIGSSIKIIIPADIGTVVPNPVYKIADFLMDIKTIFKFLKDLITLIISIINNINKLARIILNGFNSLNEIIKQLMDLLGLKWLMDLIQSIIDIFGQNILNARELLENTLSPVHFSDTQEYDNTMEALESMLENQRSANKEEQTYFADAINMLDNCMDKKAKDVISELNKSFNTSGASEETIEEIIEKLEENGDVIIAYKSPILKSSDGSSNVSEMIDGGDGGDLKFIGWHFFHPSLNHTNDTYYGTGLIDTIIKKVKSKIIKKASKNGHKRKGGVKALHIKKVGRKKIDEAYTAFYWYTYYTEDLEKDCFERTAVDNSIFIDNIIKTQNGSIVEITGLDGKTKKVFVADNMVRKGDYVTVEGVKYRVN